MFRRIAAAALTLAVGAVLLAAAWPQLLGLHRVPVIAHLVSLRAIAATSAVALIIVLLALSVLGRRFRRLGLSLTVLLVAFTMVTAAVLSTRGFGDSAFTEKGSGDVTVLSWNTLGPATEPRAIAELALESDADIVVLPETRSEVAIEAATLMKAGGSAMWSHTLSYDQISPARSTSLLTSVDLGEYTFDRAAKTTEVLPTLVATPSNGASPTIIAVHAVAPIPGQFHNWPADLELLAQLCQGDNIVMAGDFNATIDHFSGLGDAPGAALGDCFDAALSSGNAALGTWPTRIPALFGSPIDHIMATQDWKVSGMRVVGSLDGDGSDHRPVMAQLSRTQ
jgi:endonuclease/exonuclease/phosphatase (EEP) superfamily protein YafD